MRLQSKARESHPHSYGVRFFKPEDPEHVQRSWAAFLCGHIAQLGEVQLVVRKGTCIFLATRRSRQAFPSLLWCFCLLAPMCLTVRVGTSAPPCWHDRTGQGRFELCLSLSPSQTPFPALFQLPVGHRLHPVAWGQLQASPQGGGFLRAALQLLWPWKAERNWAAYKSGQLDRLPLAPSCR